MTKQINEPIRPYVDANLYGRQSAWDIIDAIKENRLETKDLIQVTGAVVYARHQRLKYLNPHNEAYNSSGIVMRIATKTSSSKEIKIARQNDITGLLNDYDVNTADELESREITAYLDSDNELVAVSAIKLRK